MISRRGILLIGGSGFFGLAIARALANAGREVHVLSRNADTGRCGNVTFHRGSQDDPAAVSPLLAECATVVHLASTTTPGSSARSPTIDIEENLLPAARLTAIMSDCPPERLIFVSSGGAIYGNPREIPVDESTPPQPLSYHAAGKAAIESLFSVFANAHQVPLAVLRPSNLYGPGQSLRQGFGLVRTLLEKARQGEPLEVWGDGGAVRDYLYIDDAVAACVHLIDNRQATSLFNAGSGTGMSITDLIRLAEQVTGRDLEVIERPARGTDVRAIVLDSTKLRRTTGWRPCTHLEEGLRWTWAWLQESRP